VPTYHPLKHVIVKSQNGKQVYGFLTQDPLASVISRNPHLLTLIKETVSTLNLSRPTEVSERNMGRAIGYTEIIETKPDDVVFFAQETKDGPYVRFVKNRKTESTTVLSLTLLRDDTGSYQLHRVILGKQSPAFPGPESTGGPDHAYWENHAVVYNGQPIRGNTLSKDWPTEHVEQKIA